MKNVHWVYGAGNRTHNISGHESPPITTGPVLQPIGDQLLFEIFAQEWPNRILIFWSIIRWSTLMYWKNSEDCFYPFYGILQLLFGVKTCLSLSLSLSSVHGINSKEELVRRDVLFFKRLCRPRHQKGQKRFVEYLSQMLINLKSSSISNCNPDLDPDAEQEMMARTNFRVAKLFNSEIVHHSDRLKLVTWLAASNQRSLFQSSKVPLCSWQQFNLNVSCTKGPSDSF